MGATAYAIDTVFVRCVVVRCDYRSFAYCSHHLLDAISGEIKYPMEEMETIKDRSWN
jgi:hypothetical protein